MALINKVVYSAENELPVYDKYSGKRKIINKVLLGTWMRAVEEKGHKYKVKTAGPDGWVLKSKTREFKHLKVFFIDVGQGDACLIEIDDKKILIDAGPRGNVHNYLNYWQYKYLIAKNKKIHFDYVFITHFDFDHYNGIIEIINDPSFTFGTIYHNGIARFKSSGRPSNMDQDLGETIINNGVKYLKTTFDGLGDIQELFDTHALAATYYKFLKAVQNAKSQNRLDKIQLANNDTPDIIMQLNNQPFKIEFLGPVMETVNGNNMFKWFTDSSHTRNGHSIVIKITYGTRSMLLGGDLNSEAEDYMISHYDNNNPFRSDIVKSCHHGSSDFTTKFMGKLRPFATVISSGDNESYAHPRADAIGCAGKYSRGSRPKVFSTELARSTNASGDILYGMINLRCDGKRIYMSQMKEQHSGADIWDSYKVR